MSLPRRRPRRAAVAADRRAARDALDLDEALDAETEALIHDTERDSPSPDWPVGPTSTPPEG